MSEEPNFGRWSAVVAPDTSTSWWQPLPSSGYVSVALSPENTPYDDFVSGMQVLPPGRSIREHGHQRNHELLFIHKGTGTVTIEDKTDAIGPGSIVLFGRHARHYLDNTGDTDMHIFWVFMPPGLDDWFPAVGRPRIIGEPMPEPFDRPEDVGAVQAKLRFVPPMPR
ncbi:cupin domain-containing protein [Polymorphobacter sp.]|uniref:cupin domain-containing protein n=1 Tax=Polymorphobacter sp. TaxID=1909290 RepID=UPI003F710006